MSVFAPPSPSEELAELCLLLGSNAAAGRFLGRERAQISRWRNAPIEIRPGSAELIDGAYTCARFVAKLVGTDRVATAVHQRWPALDYRSPAAFVQEGRPEELLATLRAAAAAADMEVGVAAVGAEGDDTEEAALVAWFAGNYEPAVHVPSPLERVDLDNDADDDDPAPPSLSDAWRGGRSMSSDRWFRS